MKTEHSPNLRRRSFLKGAGGIGVASSLLGAQTKADAADTPVPPSVKRPSFAQNQAETETPPPPVTPSAASTCGSDFMVDVIKSLGIEYMFGLTASSYRGLQESVINYAANSAPEFITCLHEESAVAMAHGYAKVAGKPAAMACHGTVGLQHASMALYNAWCDRVSVIAIIGNTMDGPKRVFGNQWNHTAQDPAAIVRDFTKWDDQPASLQAFSESMVRAYKLATTPPMEPVVIVADASLQEMELNDRGSLTIPKYAPVIPPQGDTGAVREAAQLLVKAEHPLILADRAARTEEGVRLLVELAETLGVPVVDLENRMNFPNMHPLCQSQNKGRLVVQADVILGIEVQDLYETLNDAKDNIAMTESSRLSPGAKLISLGLSDMYIKSNYQDFERFTPVDLSIAGDAEATLPALIEAVKAALPSAQQSAVAARIEVFRKMRADSYEKSRAAAAVSWDASPITTARICAEVYQLIKDEDWALVAGSLGDWPHRLWDLKHFYQYNGKSGGGGLGYGMPASVGAALAHRPKGRLCVNFQKDGDMLFTSTAMWTAAHHRIPVLTVMHNNRAYHQELMHIERMCVRRNRGIDRAKIGTEIANPDVDFGKLAQSMGVWGEGPITDPKDLGPALARAIAVVKSGQPALVDVVSQPR